MDKALNELALFAGAGGGILGSVLLGHRIVAAVEINRYRREVLLRRQRDGMLPMFPIWDDVRTFNGRPFRGTVDLVTAGFPCQPFSQAGLQRGTDDPRNMWPDAIRIIREVAPAQVFLENTPGIMQSKAGYYIFTVLRDLAEAGYETLPPLILGASDVGAPHIRKRIWIMAYARGVERGLLHEGWEESAEASGAIKDIPDSDSGRCNAGRARSGWKEGAVSQNNVDPIPHSGPYRRRFDELREPSGNPTWIVEEFPDADIFGLEKPDNLGEGVNSIEGDWWSAEPRLDRVVNGVVNRVDRIEAIGDGQVPQVVAAAFRLLSDYKMKPK